MTDAKQPRAYRSDTRQARARATRERITTSARRLFRQDGYAATSIEAIARAAGVATPTVYAAFRSKRGILLALLGLIEQDAYVSAMSAEIAEAAGDPDVQLGLLTAFHRRLFERGADLFQIVRDAGSAETDIAELWTEGEGRRRAGEAAIVHGWAEGGVLRPGLSEGEALDVLWSMTGPDFYRLLVWDCGWSPARYESWLVAAVGELLLRPA